MFNELDKKIVKIILEEKEPISSRSLALRCSVSVNTVRKEIGIINEIIEKYGFRIESRTAIGYYPVIFDEKQAVPYIQRLRYLYKRNENMPNSYSERVQYLIRKCLCGGYLTVERLADELYCSRSTILRDLDKVKSALAAFGLNLTNKRYKESGGRAGGYDYGLGVYGNEWNIRQCLIYQHKLYCIALSNHEYKEYSFKSMFFMLDGTDYHQQIRRLLVESLKEQDDFTLSFISFPKLVNYILLTASRQKFVGNLSFTKEQIAKIIGTREYAFVKKLHLRLPERFRDSFCENDFFALTMLILCFETQNHRLGSFKEGRIYIDETRELAAYLTEKYGFGEAFFDEVFHQDFSCFLYTLYNRLEFHVYYDMESLDVVRHKGIWTSDLCVDFARFYEKKHGIRLNRHDTLSVYYLFRRLHNENASEYYAQNILIISRYGIWHARFLAANVRAGYGNEVSSVEAKECNEIDNNDFLNYDLLITDITSAQGQLMPSYGLPALYVDYFTKQHRSPQIDEYFSWIQQDNEQRILKAESVHSTDLHSKEEVFRCFADIYKVCGKARQEFFIYLEENDNYIDLERENGVVFLSVVSEGVNQPQITVLINRTAFVWNENRIRIFICYFRGKTLRENQIINGILRRFIHASPELVEELTNCKKTDFLRVLYSDSMREQNI